MKHNIHEDFVKQILEDLFFPERLDEHPWTKSPIVTAEIAADRSLMQKSPGIQLVAALSSIFSDLMPVKPPRRGKRLDTRWGEFGILAAQYFAPYMFGTPAPVSLREAWGKIDQSILLFVYGRSSVELTEQDISKYKLVGDELQVAANSTISDWHRKGIIRLSSHWEERENQLIRLLEQNTAGPGNDNSLPISQVQPAENIEKPRILDSGTGHQGKVRPTGMRPQLRWWIRMIIFLSVISFLGFTGYKSWQVYQQIKMISQQIKQLQEKVTDNPGLETITVTGPLILGLQENVSSLRGEIGGMLTLFGPGLSWIPVYGADISSAADLLELADLTMKSVRLSYMASSPIVEAAQSSSPPLTPSTIAILLRKAQPQYQEARTTLASVRAIRERIKSGALSPEIQVMIIKLDKFLLLLDDTLTLAVKLPNLLGASSEGPKTYMLLMQNEDELRATGGFISSVGSFVIRDGELLGLKFESSDVYEDWSKPYPIAPWQMEKYMNIPVTLLRDANWSPDFPSSVALVEYLFAYQNGYSVDGVISIDQHALVILLGAIGPIKIQGAPELINAENVIRYMRTAKIPPGKTDLADWDRKAFIGNLADAILKKLLSGQGISGEPLLRALLQALEQRHILVQFDDTDLTGLFARHSWDGAVRAGNGDFLMSVDTNIGYNKTNAVVEKKINYDIDLRDTAHPTGDLVVFLKNNAVGKLPCNPLGTGVPSEKWYAINLCYHNYMRIYVPAGTSLIKATPRVVPGQWMALGRAVPARVDELEMDMEKIEGVMGFGTMIVVPYQQSLSTSFTFALPTRVVSTVPGSREKTYTLKIQKQPGARLTPVTIRIHLPNWAYGVKTIPSVKVTDGNILIETDLTTDVLVNVVFSLP